MGLIFGLMLIIRLGRQQGLDPEKLWNLGIIAVLSGIFGAKLLYLINEAGYYREHPGELFSLATLQAGGVWSGGVVLALILCIWYMRRNKMPILRTCDVFAPGWRWGTLSGGSGALPQAVVMGVPRMFRGR